MLTLAESVSSLEASISEYDAQTRALTAALDAVNAARAEAAAVRDNIDGGTVEARAKRLATLNANLFILEADADKLQRGVEQQRQQLCKDSDELRAALACRVNEMTHDRIREVVAKLKTEYDVSGFPIEPLAETHGSVTLLKQVGYGLQRSTNGDDERIQFARVVRAEVLDRIAV